MAYYLVLQRSPPAAIRATGFFIAFLFGFSVSANHPINNVYNGNDIDSFIHPRVSLQQNAAFLSCCKRFAIIRLQVEHKPNRVQKEEAPPHKKAGASTTTLRQMPAKEPSRTMGGRDILSHILSKMRLVFEGAVTLFEDEVCPVYKQIRESGQSSAILAFDDIGTALYVLKQHVCQLQETHHREALRQEDVQKPI